MRRVRQGTFNEDKYSSTNMLYRNELLPEAKLSKKLTRLYGKDNSKFPLLMLSEEGGIRSKTVRALNDNRYSWDTYTGMVETSIVVGLVNTNNVKPGLGHTKFEVDMEDNIFIINHIAYTADKKSQLYFHTDGTQQSNGKWRYECSLFAGKPDEFVDLSNFVAGTAWVLAAPFVGEKLSDSNRSNSKATDKWTNQFGYHRFSKHITGNIANKVVDYEVTALTEDGKEVTTNMWMPLEMEQFEIARRTKLEDILWNGKYNRDTNGVIHDNFQGEKLPSGAGVKDILVSTDQYDTYGGTLAIKKLDSIVNRITSKRVDDTPMELVLYTGKGGMAMFNDAIKSKATNSSYYDALGAEEIRSGKDGWLDYGAYFRQYRTVHNDIITVKEARIFDHGPMADMDRANGRTLNQFPFESYNMVLLDHSRMSDEDGRNIELVAEKGREYHTGVYAGMTPLPASWGVMEKNGKISGTKDIASYEMIITQGINIKNYTTSFYLEYMP